MRSTKPRPTVLHDRPPARRRRVGIISARSAGLGQTIGRCARLRVIGSSDDLETPALYPYRDWLPASGEETHDFPIYCERVRFFPDVPENEAITDLYLPLR